jgi:hypothetical protein
VSLVSQDIATSFIKGKFLSFLSLSYQCACLQLQTLFLKEKYEITRINIKNLAKTGGVNALLWGATGWAALR